MALFPPIPSWESLHPIVIHFPIVLLIAVPLLVLIGAAFSPAKGRRYLVEAFVALILGTGALYLAAETGESAAEIADHSGAVNSVLETHEHLAEQTRMIFAGLAVLLAAILWVPRFLRRVPTSVASRILPLAFVAIYAVGFVYLVRTAHEGARLVHEFGIHAMMPGSGAGLTGDASD